MLKVKIPKQRDYLKRGGVAGRKRWALDAGSLRETVTR